MPLQELTALEGALRGPGRIEIEPGRIRDWPTRYPDLLLLLREFRV